MLNSTNCNLGLRDQTLVIHIYAINSLIYFVLDVRYFLVSLIKANLLELFQFFFHIADKLLHAFRVVTVIDYPDILLRSGGLSVL